MQLVARRLCLTDYGFTRTPGQPGGRRRLQLRARRPLSACGQLRARLAIAYERLQNPRLASEAYREAVRVEPRNFDVLNTYAVFLCRRGDYHEARKYFDLAIGIPENDNAFVTMTNAGVCMKQKPDYALAESYLRQALQRRPTYGEGLLQLAILKFETGDNLGARAFLERYTANNPPSSGVLLLGIRIEEELGDRRAREAYVRQLLESFPESVEARSIRETG